MLKIMGRIFLSLLLSFGASSFWSQGALTAPVTNTTTGVSFETVQEALDAASPGDHIALVAHRFVEHLAINIPVTVSGATGGGTIIDVSTQDGWGITLSSNGITLEHLAVVAGDVNTAYAIHSEPGITGLTLEDIAVYDSNRSCIDLNGLTGPEMNTLRDITVSGSSIGFGLALSTCSNVLIENITSNDNGFGDIAIMESNYYDQEIDDVVFTGYLDLEGPQSLGGGGVVIQVDPAVVPVGTGGGFPISMNAEGFDFLLEAPGDLTGCILVHEDNVRGIANTLGANVAPLVSYDLVTQHLVVFPGMSVQSAVDAATEGATIEVEAGSYDTAPIAIDKTVTILGANVGTSGLVASNRNAESLLPGIQVNSGQPVIDGVRITAEAEVAVEVAENAGGLTLRNTIVVPSAATAVTGFASRNEVNLESVKIAGFPTGISQLSGAMALSSCRIQDADNGISIQFSADGATSTSLTNCTLENAGGKGVVLNGGDAQDLFAMTGCQFNLHETAMVFNGDPAIDIQDNAFTNSEQQLEGMDRDGQVGLCAANAFSPALRITGCTDTGASNFEACANIDQGCQYPGCTAPKACNFDPEANTDDGSCDFITCAACPLGFACNYDPEADLYKVEACDFSSCEGNGMAPDVSGRAGLMMVEGCTIPQACNYNPDADSNDGSCDFGCFGCMDANACNFDGGFTQPSNETCLFVLDLYNSSHVNCSGTCLNDANENGVCDEEEVSGCVNPEACNFLSTATLDDGTCDYTTCAGCTNPAACNHNADAWISDGSCDYNSCAGCTDGAACNFDASAAIEDGSCTYPVELYNKPYVDCADVCLNDDDGDGICNEEELAGCTDAGACNYDSGATDDDGSCDYLSCAGCTDPDYCNFMPAATIDNGSCAAPEDLYPTSIVDGVATVDCLGRCLNDADGDGICDEAEVVCPGDINGDGLRGAADILVMLSNFGCTVSCGGADLNEDGIVAATDILIALSTFGVACPQ